MICRSCGSTFSSVVTMCSRKGDKGNKNRYVYNTKCRVCKDGGLIENLPVPHIFKFLTAQLAAVNIKVKLAVMSSSKC